MSIKPDTYERKRRLREDIDASSVTYEEYETTGALELHVDEPVAALEPLLRPFLLYPVVLRSY